eukprot:m.41954 g.41954  ORF g.41954 m.41954 type:complete len:1281 (+) comp9826_c0_seq1:62-3904(+)
MEKSFRGLPASPNWFVAQGAKLHPTKGFLGYGSGSRIVILEIGSQAPRVKCVIQGHSSGERTTGFDWLVAQGEESSLSCVSCGSDGVVRLVDVDSRTSLKTHQLHDKRAAQAVSCGRHPQDVCTVASGDNKGKVVFWDTLQDTTRFFTPLGEAVITISMSVEAPTLCAVGYKGGAVLVLSSSGPRLMARLSGHAQDVQCVSWRPGTSMLCSSSQDATIKLWNISNGTSGTIESTWTLPSKSKKPGSGGSSRDKLWLTHAWLNENALVSTTHGGAILQWSADKPDDNPDMYKRQSHSHVIFSLCVSPEDAARFISISSDRQIKQWSTATRKLDWELPTIGGFVYSIDFSPVDPAMLAIACGDKLIRVWQVDVSKSYECSTLWKGIQSRVQCISWHPREEGILCFGLGDGTVGVYTVDKSKSLVCAGSQSSTTGVSCLRWGPKHGNHETIWSCVNGKVQQLFDARFSKTEGRTVQFTSDAGDKADLSATVLAWKLGVSDGSLLAVGGKDGTVRVLNGEMECLLLLSAHRSNVTGVEWSFHTDPLQLATSSVDCSVRVYNVDKLLANKGGSTQTPHHTLRVPGKVTCISWSPHPGAAKGMLVSGGMDGSAQVWDVEKERSVAYFGGHSSKLSGVKWSPLDPNFIYSGSGDQSVLCWNWTLLPAQPPVSETKRKSKSTQQAQNSKTSKQPSSREDEPRDEDSSSGNRKYKERKPKSLLPSANSTQIPAAVIRESVLDVVKWKYPTAKLDEKPVQEATLPDVALFQDREHAAVLVETEKNQHLEADQFQSAFWLSTWKGDIITVLEQACTRKCLTDSMVAMSAMGGKQMWQYVTKCYAEQLASAGDYHAAASYFLSIFCAHEAVKVYQKAGQYREAIALAKLRLGSDDPLLSELYMQWAKNSEENGAYEQASKCYLALGQPKLAVQSLTRRGGKDSFLSALTVASIASLESKELAIQCVVECHKKGDVKTAVNIVNERDDLLGCMAPLQFELVFDKCCNPSEVEANPGSCITNDVAQVEPVEAVLSVLKMHSASIEAPNSDNLVSDIFSLGLLDEAKASIYKGFLHLLEEEPCFVVYEFWTKALLALYAGAYYQHVAVYTRILFSTTYDSAEVSEAWLATLLPPSQDSDPENRLGNTIRFFMSFAKNYEICLSAGLPPCLERLKPRISPYTIASRAADEALCIESMKILSLILINNMGAQNTEAGEESCSFNSTLQTKVKEDPTFFIPFVAYFAQGSAKIGDFAKGRIRDFIESLSGSSDQVIALVKHTIPYEPVEEVVIADRVT